VTPLRRLLYPIVVIDGDCRGERHSSRHRNLGEGHDDERSLYFRVDDAAHDATFVARI